MCKIRYLPDRKRRTFWRNHRPVFMLMAVSAILVCTFACNGGLKSVPENPPSKTASQVVPKASDGAALMEERCSACHGTDKIKQAREKTAQWNQIVTRMIAKGARLTDAEKAILVDYLGQNYVP